MAGGSLQPDSKVAELLNAVPEVLELDLWICLEYKRGDWGQGFLKLALLVIGKHVAVLLDADGGAGGGGSIPLARSGSSLRKPS